MITVLFVVSFVRKSGLYFDRVNDLTQPIDHAKCKVLCMRHESMKYQV